MTRKWICLALLMIGNLLSAQTKNDETVVDRFLRYVKVNTQSKEDVNTIPSDTNVFVLSRMLEQELKDLGLENVRVDETHAYVYGTLPSNLPAGHPASGKVPVIGLISHMDTSPAVSGENVNPIIHKNYRGGDIVLPKDPSLVIAVEKNPELKKWIGSDIITADGTTLLGADDKCGIAEIMTALQYFRRNPKTLHGTIRIAFTPDEETGNGTAFFDLPGFAADFAYTVDGGTVGEISTETWNANKATVTFEGKNAHPGDAKGKMINSLYAMGEFLQHIPADMRPETTEGRVGFLHPSDVSGLEESSKIRILMRDFDLSGLEAKAKVLEEIKTKVNQKYPETRIRIDIQEQYRNMKLILDKYPQVTEFAMEAARRAGVKPYLNPVRGGTDGAELTYQGLPCPNLYTGGENYHSKLEWASTKGMEATVRTLIELPQIWVEKGIGVKNLEPLKKW